MTKKRRVFDINFDEDFSEPEASEPERRGPMAAAITENAAALEERHQAEAEIRAENDRLAHEYVALKRNGQIVDLVPIDAIRTSKLTRDRSEAPDDTLPELIESIRSVGLSNPIRVEQTEDGYELIQGFRRLSAYRALWEETGDPAFARIPAGLMARGTELEGLYRRMVDENLVRRDISFAEMARLALAYANDPNTLVSDPKDAVAALFASAGRQKRSYIGHFTTLMHHIGDQLQHPEAISRKLGLDLVRQMELHPDLVPLAQKTLEQAPNRSAETEIALLTGLTKHMNLRAGRVSQSPSNAKTTFRMSRSSGKAKCLAADGRLEVQVNCDFSAIDRKKLEKALSEFLDSLDV